MTRPDDFALRYSYNAASVPPPYYYEYAISVQADGQGEARYLPDYPQHHPGEKVTRFTVDASTLDALYALVQDSGIFDAPVTAQDARSTGGSQVELAVRAGGRHFHATAAIEAVAAALRGLLPEGFIEQP